MKKWIIAVFFIFLTGCSHIRVLNPQSDTGKDQAFLIWLSLAIMLFVLVIVFILWGRFVWKYRESKQKNNPNLPTDITENKLYETIWTVGPILLLVALAIPTISITYGQSPVTSADKTKSHVDPHSKGTHIKVTGERFIWTFEHKGGKKETGVLVMPANTKVYFHLHSKDVIHSFWIPEIAGKSDVMPHTKLIYEVKNAKPGEYEGKCAEFCGVEHAKMRFTVKVIPKKEYEKYIKEK
ncbi:cytochrome c oxidase subunit II [Aciduricibacillus chroicocephali]|uniref:Cytochrome c oxidase subunit 2 n=1 Tax=Aciduricibacillus chroicocephali TaxID=3054939 RepID=A0ABY9KVG6_9BACI|nr:cytochrome c oxidase subunit II [Bacillaceae bacterium 44XB]